MAAIATPWGRAHLVEELEIPQQAGERAFSSIVQVLENDGASASFDSRTRPAVSRDEGP
jgi:hypothetical protein